MATPVQTIHPETAQRQRPFSREVRLGLVLFGGTSLAIYINGVTREFARIVRGEGAYRWLKALTDSDVVVDIISGTSAGGINGIALAYALSNGKDPRPLSNLWRERGDIAGLFRPIGEAAPSVNSLFDSKTYCAQLKRGFDDLGRADYRPGQANARFVSPVGEIDLFVTGTRVEPKRRIILDSSGNAQLIDEHRALFLLKHRPGRKQPFDPSFRDPVTGTRPAPDAVHRGLALLANVTSCFPGAFSPVRLQAMVGEPVDDDCRLVSGWGKFDPVDGGFFFDGGVLDNKPFMSTLEAIFSRPSARLVDRRLFYVEPDPAIQVPGIPVQRAGESPTFAETAIKALSGVPRAEPILGDLTALAEHNRRVASLDRITRDLHHRLPEYAYGTGSGISIPPPLAAADDPHGGQRPSHYDRIIATVREPLLSVYLRSRKESIALMVASALFAVLEDETNAARFLEAFSTWAGDPDNERRLLNADIYFLRRRLTHVVYFLHELLSDRATAQHRRELTQRILSDVFAFLKVAETGGNGSDAEQALMARMLAQIGTFLDGLLTDPDLPPTDRQRLEQALANIPSLIADEPTTEIPEREATFDADPAKAAETVQTMQTLLETEPASTREPGLISSMLASIDELRRTLAGGPVTETDAPPEMLKLLSDGALMHDLVTMTVPFVPDLASAPGATPPGGVAFMTFLGGGFAPRGMSGGTLDTAREGVSNLLVVLNRLSEVYEVVRTAVERLVAEAPPEWRLLLAADGNTADLSRFFDLWRVFAGALEQLLAHAYSLFPQDPAELEHVIRSQPAGAFSDYLIGLNAAFRDRIAFIHRLPTDELRDGPPDPNAQRFVTMLDACEGRLLGPVSPTDDDPRSFLTLNLWNCFEQLDAVLFPVESVANAGERDLVEIHRISAVDARLAFSDRDPALKVSGDALGHFGGFLKRSWRSNDILWGRLDGCCRLLDVLLDQDRVQEMVEGKRDHLSGHFFDNGSWIEGMTPSTIFPNCPAGLANRLTSWVEQLLGNDSDASHSALAELPEIRAALIEAAQFEIISQDIATVFEDQYLDEAGWNSADLDAELRVDPETADDPLPVWESRYLDQGLTRVRAVERSNQRVRAIAEQEPPQERAARRHSTIAAGPADVPPTRPLETPLGRYFVSNYMVGSEPLKQVVPPAVLIHWASQVLLLLRTCVVNSFPGPGGRVQRSRVFTFLIEWPLRVAHWFTGLWMREPMSLRTKVAFAAITTLILGLIVNFLGERSRLGILLLIVLPIVILTAMPRLGWIGGTRAPGRPNRNVRGFAGGIGAALFSLVALALFLLTVWSVVPTWDIGAIDFSDLSDIDVLRTDSKWFPILAPYGVVAAVVLAFACWRFAAPRADGPTETPSTG